MRTPGQRQSETIDPITVALEEAVERSSIKI